MRILDTAAVSTRTKECKKRVEPGESNDSRADQSTIFSVGGWWIFWQPLLNVGHGYPALGALSRPSTEGTTDVCVVAETMGG